MKTRFDLSRVWIPSSERTVLICEMDTGHLMNVLKMFIRQPWRTLNMLIEDLEAAPTPWTMNPERSLRQLSLYNVTSSSEQELIEYALNSPLGQAMRSELASRGVNVPNFLELIGGNEYGNQD